jgi:hypothetical protein
VAAASPNRPALTWICANSAALRSVTAGLPARNFCSRSHVSPRPHEHGDSTHGEQCGGSVGLLLAQQGRGLHGHQPVALRQLGRRRRRSRRLLAALVRLGVGRQSRVRPGRCQTSDAPCS